MVLTADEDANFRAVKNLARARGWDVIELLDHHWMLRTQQKIKLDQLVVLRNLYTRISSLTPEQMLELAGRDTANLTPAEMHRIIVAWIDTFIRVWEEEPPL